MSPVPLNEPLSKLNLERINTHTTIVLMYCSIHLPLLPSELAQLITVIADELHESGLEVILVIPAMLKG